MNENKMKDLNLYSCMMQPPLPVSWVYLIPFILLQRYVFFLIE